MKKLIASAAALLLSCSFMGVTAFAAETEASADVNVTISDKDGNLALVQEKITVKDIDNDGKLTINDALYIAHEEKFEGGAAAGYGSSTGQYGLSLDKLWGTANGGSYGYYVNNTAAMGLADNVSDGDCINAFVYTDITTWSDKYSFFDTDTAECNTGDELTLVLSYAGYDAAWNPVTYPVAGAVITVNGTATEYKTDAAGKVTVKIENEGQNLISAVSDSMILVHPVCVVNAAPALVVTTTAVTTEAPVVTTTEASAVTTTEASTTTTVVLTSTAPSATTAPSVTTTAKSVTTTKATKKTEASAPKTGENGSGVMIAVLAASAASLALTRRKK